MPRPGSLAAVSVIILLLGPVAGCSREEKTPVGGVLEYDPAEDPSVQAAEEYMQDPTAGMEGQGGSRP